MTELRDGFNAARLLTTFAAMEAACMALLILTPSSIARFWSNVACGVSIACWPWLLVCNKRGYGRVGIRRAYRLAHRLAWEITNGAIQPGLFVLHRCDYPPCCNPAHLFLGTHDDNTADMMLKARQPRGADKAQSKLSDDDVRAIRSRRADGATLLAIGNDFGISFTQVHHIVTRKQWRHVV